MKHSGAPIYEGHRTKDNKDNKDTYIHTIHTYMPTRRDALHAKETYRVPSAL